MDQTAEGEGFLLVANLTNNHAECTRLTLHFGTFNWRGWRNSWKFQKLLIGERKEASGECGNKFFQLYVWYMLFEEKNNNKENKKLQFDEEYIHILWFECWIINEGKVSVA